MGSSYFNSKRKTWPCNLYDFNRRSQGTHFNYGKRRTAKNAAQNLKEKPDNVYLMDENFDKFMWSSDMSVSDYVIKFQQLNFKAKSLQMEILDDGVLAYRLLDSANLTNEQKQPVNTTVHKMDHQVMKDTN